MHGSTTAELRFDGVVVPVESRLGREGGAWDLSMRTVLASRISAAAQGLGIAAAAYQIGMSWARYRGLLDDPTHQRVQFWLADLRTSVHVARLQLHAVARSLDHGRADLTAEVGMAKVLCTDLAMAATDDLLALLGPDADVTEQGVERYARDAKVTQIYDGTNQIQRMLIGRDSKRRMSEERPRAAFGPASAVGDAGAPGGDRDLQLQPTSSNSRSSS
jgi:alkylation response protein AidB-like acyl-CoA dehydrogenase